MRTLLLGITICTAASAQTFETPRQQIDFYGGGSYQVNVTGAAVLGTAVRYNFGQHFGVFGYYNFSPVDSEFGARGSTEFRASRNTQDSGGGLELHAPGRLQPYIFGTLGGISLQDRLSLHNYALNFKGAFTESHFAYGGGVGLRYYFNRKVAVFVESRLVRAAVAHSDYFVRGTVGVAVSIPKFE